MDYDDLLINFISVLKRNPSIKNKLADIYQYIMIDEYQDSNYLQEKIIFCYVKRIVTLQWYVMITNASMDLEEVW